MIIDLWIPCFQGYNTVRTVYTMFTLHAEVIQIFLTPSDSNWKEHMITKHFEEIEGCDCRTTGMIIVFVHTTHISVKSAHEWQFRTLTALPLELDTCHVQT